MRSPISIFIVMLLLVVSCGRTGIRTDSRTGFGCSARRTGTGAGITFSIVTLQGPSSMGMIWMIDSLRRASAPSVSVEIVAEPIQVRKQMLEGTADFAVLPLTMAAILYNKGIDYRLVAIPVWGTLYLAGSDPSLTEWEQLRGQRVYTMGRGMTPDVLFRHLLQQHGIEPDNDVTLDYSFPTHLDLANAAAAGRARLAVLSEPQLSLAMHHNQGLKPLIDLNRAWKELQGAEMAQTAFLVKGSVANAHPELVQQLMHTYAASTQRIHRSPGSAAVLMARYGLLPDATVARQSIPRSNLNFVAADTIRETINNYLQVFYDMNPEIIGGAIPNEEFIY